MVVSQANRTGRKGRQRRGCLGAALGARAAATRACVRGPAPLAPHLSFLFYPTVTEHLGNGNGTPLPVLEGQDLRLLCVAHSNPPASLSWAQGGQTLHPSQPSDPGVLELPQIQREHEGEFTCHAQNPLGSQKASLSLSVVGEWGVGVPGARELVCKCGRGETSERGPLWGGEGRGAP